MWTLTVARIEGTREMLFNAIIESLDDNYLPIEVNKQYVDVEGNADQELIWKYAVIVKEQVQFTRSREELIAFKEKLEESCNYNTRNITIIDDVTVKKLLSQDAMLREFSLDLYLNKQKEKSTTEKNYY